MKSNTDTNSTIYYKEQINQLEGKVKEYVNKIDRITEQNKQLQKELSRSHADEHYETKYIELDNKNHELNRKLSQLTLQNTTLQSEITKLTSEIDTLLQEGQRLRKSEQEKAYR